MKDMKDMKDTKDTKRVDGTPEERERLAAGNNNSALERCEPSPPSPGERRRTAFRSTRLFMIVFLSGWVMQGMFFTYFVGVITTVEKLFQIESKTTGTLLAATEIGQICTALFLTYFAGRGHRPRWIAAMMLVLAAGVLGCVVPHAVYGTRLLDAHMGAHDASEGSLCAVGGGGGGGVAAPHNGTCDAGLLASQRTHSDITAVVIPWIFVCLLVVGVGQTGIVTLGIPYIDDNVGSRQSPLYMAITIGIRVIGPALGFLLGALCTRVYVDPLATPGFEPSDPRWVGAWWLGMLLVAGLIVLLSLLMFCFPRSIRHAAPAPAPAPAPAYHKTDRKTDRKNKKGDHFFKDFFSTIKRQLTNDILMCRTASSVLHLMPINGLYSFLPKYLETQFKLAPYDANLVSGIGGILVMGLGIISSGVVILRFVPTARQVAAWTAATALLYGTGMVALMFVSCPTEQFASLRPPPEPGRAPAAAPAAPWPHAAAPAARLGPACSSLCQCENNKFSAICGQDGVTYLSACHAGCRSRRRLGAATHYYNCECVNSSSVAPLERVRPLNNIELLSENEWGYAVGGECRGECGQFYLFLVLFALIMFVHASGEVGSVLLIIRCTDPKDKAMAMGVIQFAIGVFGNVPCPIVFGAAVDAACFAREAVCGVPGACARYRDDTFRHYFLGLTGGIMLLAFLMDLLVWSKAGRIDINPEESAGAGAATPGAGVSTQLLALPASATATGPADAAV